MTTVEIINLLAIIVGPIAAVIIGLWIEDRREVRQRKFETFRMLMRSRSLRLSPEHVAGLNLVELEFATDAAVMSAWRSYMEHLDGSLHPYPRETRDVEPFHKERDNRLVKLIHQVGKSLGFEHIQQIDILKGNYTPQAWLNDEEQQRQLRTLLIELLAGQRAMPIIPHNPNAAAGPYPPAPVDRRVVNGGGA